MAFDRRRALLGAVAVFLGAALLLSMYLRRSGARPPSEDELFARQGPRVTRHDAVNAAVDPAPSRAAASAEGRTLWQERLSRAQQTLQQLLDHNRYPPTSRPIAEHPDQVLPHFVPDQVLPLKRKDGALTDARVMRRQDRFYLVGDEAVTFTVACATSAGPAPCEILSAVARAESAPARETALSFVAAEAGAFTATLRPRAQGFADVFGPLQVVVDLRIDGEEGQTSFEVVFTPEAPAVFTGAVREALVDGSLDLFVELQVERPGRYVITARASDVGGRDFAYLSFNEVLAPGQQEARLQLFGELILDEKAQAPFHLRDLEGFRLLEDTFPDRELMTALSGVFHTTKGYADRDFSDRGWQSDDTARQARQLADDVAEAKGHVAAGE